MSVVAVAGWPLVLRWSSPDVVVVAADGSNVHFGWDCPQVFSGGGRVDVGRRMLPVACPQVVMLGCRQCRPEAVRLLRVLARQKALAGNLLSSAAGQNGGRLVSFEPVTLLREVVATAERVAGEAEQAAAAVVDRRRQRQLVHVAAVGRQLQLAAEQAVGVLRCRLVSSGADQVLRLQLVAARVAAARSGQLAWPARLAVGRVRDTGSLQAAGEVLVECDTSTAAGRRLRQQAVGVLDQLRVAAGRLDVSGACVRPVLVAGSSRWREWLVRHAAGRFGRPLVAAGGSVLLVVPAEVADLLKDADLEGVWVGTVEVVDRQVLQVAVKLAEEQMRFALLPDGVTWDGLLAAASSALAA